MANNQLDKIKSGKLSQAKIYESVIISKFTWRLLAW